MARWCLLAWALAGGRAAWALAEASDAMSLLQHAAAPATTAHETFGLDEKVEVKIESGSKAGTWVPAVISRNHFKGSYDVSVALGPNGRYDTQLSLGERSVRRSQDARAWEQATKHYQEDLEDAKKVILQLNRDDLRRTRARLLASGLNISAVQAKMAAMQRDAVSRKEKAMWDRGCPAGYQAVDGDAHGGDQFGRNMTNRQEALDLCAEECNAQPLCLSFEWSLSGKVCNLNKVVAPDRFPHFADYIFCQQVSAAATAALSQASQKSSPVKRIRPRPRAPAAEPSAAVNSSTGSVTTEPMAAAEPSAAAESSVAAEPSAATEAGVVTGSSEAQ